MTNARPTTNEMIRRYREQRALLVRMIKIQWVVILVLVVTVILSFVLRPARVPAEVNAADAGTTLESVEPTSKPAGPTSNTQDNGCHVSGKDAQITTCEYISTYTAEPEPECLGKYKITAYCSCEKCCGSWAKNRPTDDNGEPIVMTASGARAVEGVTVAVDPSVIPYGTEVIINGHTFIAHDTGAACRNGKVIDVYFASHEAALQFGVQYADVYIKSK